MGGIMKMLEDTYAEAAFAECNVESGFEVQMKSQEKRQGESVREWLDDTSAAVAFADAGEHDTARGIAEGRQDTPQEEAPLIMVIGGPESFSDHLVNYAVDMASRMKASIMALNINKSKDDSYALQFRKAAEARGVQFSHLVRAGNKDQIVEALSRKHSNLQYVMNEPPRPSVTSIPVYSPAPTAGVRPRARPHV